MNGARRQIWSPFFPRCHLDGSFLLYRLLCWHRRYIDENETFTASWLKHTGVKDNDMVDKTITKFADA